MSRGLLGWAAGRRTRKNALLPPSGLGWRLERALLLRFPPLLPPPLPPSPFRSSWNEKTGGKEMAVSPGAPST